jgi:hypothetical protein
LVIGQVRGLHELVAALVGLVLERGEDANDFVALALRGSAFLSAVGCFAAQDLTAYCQKVKLVPIAKPQSLLSQPVPSIHSPTLKISSSAAV